MSKISIVCSRIITEGQDKGLPFYDTQKMEQEIKDLIRDLIDETFDKDDAKALELWQKVEAL